MYQYSFIKGKDTTLTHNVIYRGDWVQDTWELSVLPYRFSVNIKVFYKVKSTLFRDLFIIYENFTIMTLLALFCRIYACISFRRHTLELCFNILFM